MLPSLSSGEERISPGRRLGTKGSPGRRTSTGRGRLGLGGGAVGGKDLDGEGQWHRAQLR